MTASALPVPAHDTRVITLISVAHAASHFNQLVLPPLFPFLIDAFGVGYTELGLMMTLLVCLGSAWSIGAHSES